MIEVLAAAEHQVFEQVSKTGLSRSFVFRAYVVPGIDGNDRCFVILVYEHGETIGQHKLGVRDVRDWNVDLLVLDGGGFGLPDRC